MITSKFGVKIVSEGHTSYYLNKYQDPKKSTKIINDYVKVVDLKVRKSNRKIMTAI